MLWSRLAVLVACGVLAAACADRGKGTGSASTQPSLSQTTGKGKGTYKIGKPYQVAGVWYYPHEEPDYDETGIASWYGPGFHGKATANGEEYDQNDLTAAHKTLPMPSYVRVTNLENGRSIIVRVNDRGPFVNGRIIDMTRRGAQLLGFIGQGTARVRVQAVPGGGPEGDQPLPPVGPQERDMPIQVAAQSSKGAVTSEELAPPPGVRAQAGAPTSPPPQPRGPSATEIVAVQPTAQPIDLAKQPVKQVAVAPTAIWVQAGAFTQFENAHRLSARLSPIGNVRVTTANVNGTDFYRVRVGPIPSVEDADRALAQVIATGQQDARIIVD